MKQWLSGTRSRPCKSQLHPRTKTKTKTTSVLAQHAITAWRYRL